MKLGIAIPTDADSWRTVARAEQLGFHSAWFYDTQLLNADCFVAMGAAAVQTGHIRLGTGVLVPSNRIAPVTANCLASLNKLAPGRVDFGVGTGFTARRTMGQRALTRAELADYIRVVQAMLAGETVDWHDQDGAHKVRFLNPELGFVNLDDPVGLHVSAMGPRMRQMTAEMGADWLAFAFSTKTALRDIVTMRQAWADAGHDPDARQASVFFAGCVLADGESMTSERVLAQAMPAAMVLLHTLADDEDDGTVADRLPEGLRDVAKRYVEMTRGYEPADARYLTIHKNHMMKLRPEERDFAVADLVRGRTLTGTPDQIRAMLTDLAAAGYTQVIIQITPGQEAALDDWAQLLDVA